jgi:hypothetical protein
LETPKHESQLKLEGYRWWDAWDRQRITGFLETLADRGFIARDTAPEKVRTPGPWRMTQEGREAATRGDFLGD